MALALTWLFLDPRGDPDWAAWGDELGGVSRLEACLKLLVEEVRADELCLDPLRDPAELVELLLPVTGVALAPVAPEVSWGRGWRLGMAPEADPEDWRCPAEIGGELELIMIEEFCPKETLFLVAASPISLCACSLSAEMGRRFELGLGGL